MKPDLKQTIERHLSAIYPPDRLAAVMAAVAEDEAGLQREAPTFRNPVNQGFFANAVSGAALYRTLRNYGRDDALAAVEAVMAEMVRQDMEGSRLKKLAFANLHRFRPVATLLTALFCRLNEEKGWKARAVDSDAFLAVDFHQCGLLNYFTGLGIPELCCAYCKGDDIVATYLKGLNFQREQLLANGDPVCSFRYYWKK
jgi:hypothetical protein